MKRNHRIYVLTFILLTSMACASTPNIESINTQAAQTVIAGLTQNAPQATLPNTLEPLQTVVTSTFTFTPEPATFTPTESPTPTQTLITLPIFTLPVFTSTPLVASISVSIPTNCRSGPGKAYEIQGALLVGETADVYGREFTNNYWYIRNPDIDPEFCWVWGEYATLVGPALLVPVLTPPPTPTATLTPLPSLTPTPAPAFKAEFTNMDSCSGNWWVEIKLKNTGSTAFKSVDISVKDKVTDKLVENLADGFTNIDGCLSRTTKDILGIDDTYLLSSPSFNYNPGGNNLVVTITLCSDTGQKGKCAIRKVDFTP